MRGSLVLIPLTTLSALVAAYFGAWLQDRFARKAEMRKTAHDDAAATKALALAVEQREQEERLVADMKAKLELLRLFTELERSLNPIRWLTEVRHEDVDREGEFLVEKLAAHRRGGVSEQISAVLPLVVHRQQRQVLAVCNDIATHWRQLGTYHGDHWIAQLAVASSVASDAVDLLGALLRGDEPSMPGTCLLRRLPKDGSTRALRKWSDAYMIEPKSYVRALAGSADAIGGVRRI